MKCNLSYFYLPCSSILQAERNTKQYPSIELCEAALIYAETDCDVQKLLKLCETKILKFRGENAIKYLCNCMKKVS